MTGHRAGHLSRHVRFGMTARWPVMNAYVNIMAGKY